MNHSKKIYLFLLGILLLGIFFTTRIVVLNAREPLSVEKTEVVNITPSSADIFVTFNRPVRWKVFLRKETDEVPEVSQNSFLDDTPEIFFDGLDPKTEYFYYGLFKDAHGNKVETPPASFTTLEKEEAGKAVLPGVKNFKVSNKNKKDAVEIILSWLPPKEEALGGSYEIRYARRLLLAGAENSLNPPFQDPETFSAEGVAVKGAPELAAGGGVQSFKVDLPYPVQAGPFIAYYFALRVTDKEGNRSLLTPALWASSLEEATVLEGAKPPGLVTKITPALLPLTTTYLKRARAFFAVPNNASWVASTMGSNGEVWLAQSQNTALEERPARPLKGLSEQSGSGIIFKLTGEWKEVYIDTKDNRVTAFYDKDKKFVRQEK